MGEVADPETYSATCLNIQAHQVPVLGLQVALAGRGKYFLSMGITTK